MDRKAVYLLATVCACSIVTGSFTIQTHCIAIAWELPGDSHNLSYFTLSLCISCCNPQRLTLRSCDPSKKLLKACCITRMPFQMAVALQGVGNAVVAMYTTIRSLWGQFVGPPSKVHAPRGMQHPPPLARKRGATCKVLACEREPQQALQLLGTWCTACSLLYTEAALQEAARPGGQGSVAGTAYMAPGMLWGPLDGPQRWMHAP